MYKRYLKRWLDFTIVLCVLLVIWPILLVIAVWLHFANKGAGAFFTQERPGKDGRIFKVIKFKSMTDERDAEGRLLPDAQRLTKVGRFIRSTSLDELPQLLNVLKGDMALVGPRPLLPEYLPYYTEREQLRHTVRPGITGWAQVNGRNLLTWDEKLEKDVWYVEHLSFMLDVKIILLTVKNVVKNPRIFKTMNLDPAITLETTKVWFNNNQDRKDRFDFVLENRYGIIAFTGITNIKDGVGETYSFVSPAEQGKGYGTIARYHTCKYGFEKLGLNRIVSYCNEDNIASIKVNEKLGYEFVGTVVRKNIDGKTVVKMCYELTKNKLRCVWNVKR